MKFKMIVFLFLCVFLLSCANVNAYASTDFAMSYLQTTEDTAGNIPSVEDKLNKLLLDLNNLQVTLKKEGRAVNKNTLQKVKLITRRIDRAVKLIPPSKCFGVIKVTMDDFYKLVSRLGTGIACGPPIVPPFLDDFAPSTLTGDCILPDQFGPFGEVYGVYTEARELFHIDLDSNMVLDACEGTVN